MSGWTETWTFVYDFLALRFSDSPKVHYCYPIMRISEERSQYQEIPEVVRSDGMNILGLVMFSVSLGIVIARIGDEGAPMKAFFKSLEAVSMRLISLVIWCGRDFFFFIIGRNVCLVVLCVFTDRDSKSDQDTTV